MSLRILAEDEIAELRPGDTVHRRLRDTRSWPADRPDLRPPDPIPSDWSGPIVLGPEHGFGGCPQDPDLIPYEAEPGMCVGDACLWSWACDWDIAVDDGAIADATADAIEAWLGIMGARRRFGASIGRLQGLIEEYYPDYD